MRKLLKELSELNGGSGFEEEVTAYVAKELDKLNIKDYHFDALGTLYVKLEGKDPKAPAILLDAHTDEVCFLVKYIDDKGFIFLETVGYFSPMILFGQRVRIITKNGPIQGSIGVKSFHLSSSDGSSLSPNIDDMWVDIGAKNREDAKKLGVKPGVPVLFDVPCIELSNNCVMGKCFDNRAACAVLIETLKILVKERPEATVYFTFSTQEEQLLRGAQLIFKGLRKFFGRVPDFCIAYDITLAGDTPQVKRQKAPVDIGKGVGIKVLEKSTVAAEFVHITPRKVVGYFESICEQNNIPYQLDLMLGCTNAAVFGIQEVGVLVGGISIPCRYTHSPIELVSMDDVNSALELTVKAIRNINQLSTVV